MLVPAQVMLAAGYIVADVVLELLPSQLDAAGQGIEGFSAQAWDLGQARICLQVQHGPGSVMNESPAETVTVQASSDVK